MPNKAFYLHHRLYHTYNSYSNFILYMLVSQFFIFIVHLFGAFYLLLSTLLVFGLDVKLCFVVQ